MSDANIAAHKDMEEGTNELKKLQQRLNHESIRHQFRTKLVGGLNEEDVTKYIEDLEDKLKKIEQTNKQSSDEIYSLKTKLYTELECKDCLQIELDEAKQNLITAIVEFKQKQMDYKSKNEKYNAENFQLKNELQQIAGKIKELEKVTTETKHMKELIEQRAVNLEDENNALKAKISEMTEENMQYNEIKKEYNQVTEELKAAEELLIQSKTECEQLKEILVKLENENNQMQISMSKLTDENLLVDILKNENKQMSEEIKTYEELLNQTSIENEHIMRDANKFKNENILLNEKISELENSIFEKNYRINEINDVCAALNEQLKSEKLYSEKLNMDSVILKQKISSLQQTINEKLIELDEQKRISDNAVLELNLEKSEALNYKINGFKEELGSVYEKMESLEYESKQNSKLSNILKQQLAAQHSRAEKAEDDLTKLMKLLSEVEDKFYSKRDILGDEFIQQIEKQISKQPKTNGKIINL